MFQKSKMLKTLSEGLSPDYDGLYSSFDSASGHEFYESSKQLFRHLNNQLEQTGKQCHHEQ
jgi:hypothetical protein